MNQHARIILLLLLIAAALAVQIPAMLKVHIVEYDEAIFLNVARNIQRTGLPLRSLGEQGVFYFEHTPLYVYLLSLYAHPTATGIFLARLVTTSLCLGCVLVVFFVGEQVSSTTAGFVAGLLLAINPFFATYAFFIYMEIPMVFAMLGGLLLIVKWTQNERNILLGGAGLFFAAAALFKELALLFTFVCAAHVFYKCLQRGTPFWKPLLIILVPSIVGMLAWGTWCWNLAPTTFSGVLRRWVNSATVQNVLDPRLGVTINQWVSKIAFDLLGIAITIGTITSLGILFVRKKRWSVIHPILAGYPIAAIGISFVIRLKELRHIIGVIPIAALLIGVSIDWEWILAWGRSNQWKKYALTASAASCLLLASPFRIPTQNPAQIEAWLNAVYAHRVLHNDPYHNILRLAGTYVQEHTTPEEIITVTHIGPVVGYYADRHYNMLYTLRLEPVLQILEQTDYLIWDHTLFLGMTDEQTQTVQDYVREHFEVEIEIQDDYRRLKIYRRSITSDLETTHLVQPSSKSQWSP